MNKEPTPIKKGRRKLRCMIGSHWFIERKRVEIDRDTSWHKIDVKGNEVPGTKFHKVTYIVVEECGYDDVCQEQRAFKEVWREKNDTRRLSREPIHLSLAKELIFIEKV